MMCSCCLNVLQAELQPLHIRLQRPLGQEIDVRAGLIAYTKRYLKSLLSSIHHGSRLPRHGRA